MAVFYRIVQQQRAATAMDGEGARLFGGRWNLAGVAAVYLAESRALAALEVLVHAPGEVILLDWRIIAVEVPDDSIERVDVSGLPASWRERPGSREAQRFGSEWLRAGTGVALLLPSVVIPEEHSLLLNPRHPDVRKIAAAEPERISFDSRLKD